MRFSLRLLRFVPLVLALPGAPSSFAVPDGSAAPSPPAPLPARLHGVQGLRDLRHAAWTLRDGAPGNIRALAQGADGFLWLGAATGLYRFDGLRFERIEPDTDDPRRSLQVTALLAARDGTIWVGYDFGGIAAYRDGHLRAANPWPPEGGISSIVETRDGAIWVAAESRGKLVLSRLAHGRWTRWGKAQGLVEGMMGPLLPLADGGLLVAQPPALLRLAPGASRFVPVDQAKGQARGQNGPLASYAALAQDARGQVWLADDHGLRTLGAPGSLGPRRPAVTPLSPVGTPYVTRHLLIDAGGDAWITGQDAGLVRLSLPAGTPETPSALSASLTLSALADREGNIWIGTQSGLDRFSAATLIPAGSQDAPVTALIPATGSAQAGVFYAGLKGVYHAGPQADAPRLIFPKSDIGVLCGDGRQLLAISLTGAFLLDLAPDGSLARQRAVTGPLSVSCARDAQGTFWTGMDRLYRLDGTRLVAAPGPLGQPGATITMLRSNGAGNGARHGTPGLIMARARQGLFQVSGQDARLFLPTGTLPIGSITTLTPADGSAGGGWWIGGQKGLARIVPGQPTRSLTERTWPMLAGLTGIRRTADGWTWLIGAAGIVRVPSASLDQALDRALDRVQARPNPKLMPPAGAQMLGREGDYAARANLFDADDIARDASGRLWFATSRGLAWTDADHLARSTLPPPVVIRALRADGRNHALSTAPIMLAAHTGRVQIDFTALSLSDPSANRFRYRLGDADEPDSEKPGGDSPNSDWPNSDWIDAGTTREALFTNLPPGDYLFRVTAANADGTWNPTGARLRFSIAPAFYQTRWFLLGCLALGCGALWLVYRRRLATVALRARSRVEAQLSERERIARELHDTLLQGFQGLMLRFQAVVELLPPGARARLALESALDRAEDVLVESRERVHVLREDLRPVALADRLAAIAAQALSLQPHQPASGQPGWRIDENGLPRPVCAPVADEIGRIVREALSNALRHARAQIIVVRISHGSERLVVSVIDDGVGLPAAVREAGRREGHYGLVGMRERAGRLNGTLDVFARPPRGTEIRLTVPARIAYQ